MSNKRKGTPGGGRPSKRAKTSNYGGKTELERQQEEYDKFLQQQEEKERAAAYRELQDEQMKQENNSDYTTNTNNNNNYITNNIVEGTPSESDDNDDDYLPAKQNQIADGSDDDDDNDYDLEPRPNDNSSAYVHPERSAQMNGSSDYSASARDRDRDREQQQPLPRSYSNGHSNNYHSYNNDHDEQIKEEEEEVLTCKDLRGVQLSRSQLEKLCQEPYFADFIHGLYCRIFIGHRTTSTGQKEAMYRVCKMIGTQNYRRQYKLTDKKTLVYTSLLIQHGSSERVFKIIAASDGPFSNKEFDQWKKQMKNDGLQLPSKDYLSSIYLDAVKRHKNFVYTDDDLRAMRRQKEETFNAKNLANPHKEKLKVNTLISGLEDGARKDRYLIYLVDINKEIERRNSVANQTNKVSIAAINERNRKNNRAVLRKAREKEIRKQQLMKGKKKTLDPFTRSLTAPTIESFHAINDDKEAKKKEEERLKKEAEEERLRKIEQENEKLNNLSILSDFNAKKKNKSLIKPLSIDEYEVSNDGQCTLIKDPLWSTIHSIAKEFAQNFNDLELPLTIQTQPKFGRNTGKSRFAAKYCKEPDENCQIITVDEYLKDKKYR